MDSNFASLPLGQDQPVLSLPARNSIAFLSAVFDCWRSRRLFAITRDAAALQELGLPIKTLAEVPSDDSDGWGRFAHSPDRSDTAAQIVFSSGTEGRPKAIVISHRNLADVVDRLNAAMGVTDEIREYIGVPVTYSFGLGRARAVATAGGAFFLPDRFDPVQIRDMLLQDRINAISAVPSLWRLVLDAPEVIGTAGTRVRWIEIGSQYMAAADKRAMREMFPNARIVQHYGLTEASRSSFLDISQAPDAVLDSVGPVAGPVELRVTEDGAIAIRGDHVARGLLQDGNVLPLTDGDGWLVTRDRGEIRDGWLYFLGRLDDQINLAGIKIGAEALEADIRALLPGAADHFAIAPVPDPARGEAVLLAVEKAAGDHAPLIHEATRLVLNRRGVRVGHGPGSVLKIATPDQLPRTVTGKVQRRLLTRDWTAAPTNGPVSALATGTAEDRPVGAPAPTPAEIRLAGIWARVVGAGEVVPEASFYESGGDSLSSVQIGLVMEREGLPRPVIRATLEGRSLRAAAALLLNPAGSAAPDGPAEPSDAADSTLPDGARRSWAITMVRALMAISVVISHWGPGLFGRLGIDQRAESVLSLVYRAGTPGFAAVFGIGIGYFMLSDFSAKRASALQRLGSSFRLVMLGIVLLGVFKLAGHVVRNEAIGGLQVAHAFYGVLGYYALMLGTARWWLPPLARLRDPLPWLLGGLPALWLMWQIVPSFLPDQQLQSVLEWPRLMLVAGYNVFKMTAVAVAGMAAGLWLARQRDSRHAIGTLLLGGSLGLVLMAMTMVEAYGIDSFARRDTPVFTSLPGLIFYLSLAAAGVGAFMALLSAWGGMGRLQRLPLKLLVVTGGLALPIYVFHGLVFPGRDLLTAAGLPGPVALATGIGCFLVVMAYMGRRLWRMYFS